MGSGAGRKWDLFEDLGNRKAGICFQTSLNNVSQSGIWGHLHQRNLRGSCQLQGSTGHDEPVQSVAPGVCLLMSVVGPRHSSGPAIITLLSSDQICFVQGSTPPWQNSGANPVWFERIRKPLVPPLMTGLAEGRGPVLTKGMCQDRGWGFWKAGFPLWKPPLSLPCMLLCLCDAWAWGLSCTPENSQRQSSRYPHWYIKCDGVLGGGNFKNWDIIHRT